LQRATAAEVCIADIEPVD